MLFNPHQILSTFGTDPWAPHADEILPAEAPILMNSLMVVQVDGAISAIHWWDTHCVFPICRGKRCVLKLQGVLMSQNCLVCCDFNMNFTVIHPQQMGRVGCCRCIAPPQCAAHKLFHSQQQILPCWWGVPQLPPTASAIPWKKWTL